MRIVTMNEVKEKMLNWIKLVADTVRVTAWPRGRNVVIDNWGIPVFTNDWVTCVREIFSEDKIENIGVSLVKSACEKTNKLAGDWTTATAILTYAIAKEGIKYINEWTNPFKLGKALQEVGQTIIKIVKSQGKELTTKDEVQQIATISAQDEEVGEIIANAMDTVGNDGTILIEQGNQQWIQVEIKTGLQFETGFLSPYMANQGMEFVADNISILVTDETIEHINQILPLLTMLEKTGMKDLVIICDNIETESAVRIAQLKHSWLFNITCIKAPGFGALKQELLQDIAVVTGATMITRELGNSIAKTTLPDLGSCWHIKSTPNSTIITDGAGSTDKILERVENIKAQQEQTSNEYEITKHQERISKLSGGIAVIKVGAPSEMETKNKIFKIEDALNATKSAVEEWIVDGGWVALYSIKILSNMADNLPDDYTELARKILTQAIKYPYLNIIRNAGYDAEKIAKDQPMGMGFDSNMGIYVNMIDHGIIDPIKVIRVALENAISSATMLLTTEATITDVPKE